MPRKPVANKATPKAAKAPRQHVEKPGLKGGTGELVPQPHGGALKRGGTVSPGRPPNSVRALLAFEAIEGVPVLREILRGEPVKRAAIPLSAVLKHATCPECHGKLQRKADDPTGSTPAQLVTLEGIESATPGDRVRAFDAFAKYGIGTKDEVTVISPDVRARVERTVQLIAQQETWSSEELLRRLDPIWSGDT